MFCAIARSAPAKLLATRTSYPDTGTSPEFLIWFDYEEPSDNSKLRHLRIFRLIKPSMAAKIAEPMIDQITGNG